MTDGPGPVRHLLDIDDLSTADLIAVLDLAEERDPAPVLAGRGIALLFEKPSLRTRNATEMAIVQLGGHPISMRAEDINLDRREPAGDVGRVLSRYHAAIGARVFEHVKLERLAEASSVPVINLLSDEGHPCQILADLLTLRQHWGGLAGRTIAYVGDGNNVCQSLMVGAALAGMLVRIATPSGFEPSKEALARASSLSTDLVISDRPDEAVAGADAVYTDVWASMGQEEEAIPRQRAFRGFTVDESLMSLAAPDALFLHCLPAHRNQEVAAAVVDGPQSVVWEQAENRMHSMRGLLLLLLGGARG